MLHGMGSASSGSHGNQPINALSVKTVAPLRGRNSLIVSPLVAWVQSSDAPQGPAASGLTCVAALLHMTCLCIRGQKVAMGFSFLPLFGAFTLLSLADIQSFPESLLGESDFSVGRNSPMDQGLEALDDEPDCICHSGG